MKVAERKEQYRLLREAVNSRDLKAVEQLLDNGMDADCGKQVS